MNNSTNIASKPPSSPIRAARSSMETGFAASAAWVRSVAVPWPGGAAVPRSLLATDGVVASPARVFGIDEAADELASGARRCWTAARAVDLGIGPCRCALDVSTPVIGRVTDRCRRRRAVGPQQLGVGRNGRRGAHPRLVAGGLVRGPRHGKLRRAVSGSGGTGAAVRAGPVGVGSACANPARAGADGAGSDGAGSDRADPDWSDPGSGSVGIRAGVGPGPGPGLGYAWRAVGESVGVRTRYRRGGEGRVTSERPAVSIVGDHRVDRGEPRGDVTAIVKHRQPERRWPVGRDANGLHSRHRTIEVFVVGDPCDRPGVAANGRRRRRERRSRNRTG